MWLLRKPQNRKRRACAISVRARKKTDSGQRWVYMVIWQAVTFGAHCTLNSCWRSHICGNCGPLWNAFTEIQEVTKYKISNSSLCPHILNTALCGVSDLYLTEVVWLLAWLIIQPKAIVWVTHLLCSWKVISRYYLWVSLHCSQCLVNMI